MTKEEWMHRMTIIKDPNAMRVMSACIAFGPAEEDGSSYEVRRLCACLALGISEGQLAAAEKALERVGLLKQTLMQ